MKKPLTKSDVEALTKKTPAKRKVSDLIKAAGFKEVKGARYDKPKRKVRVEIKEWLSTMIGMRYYWEAEAYDLQCRRLYKTERGARENARRFWGQFGVKVEVVE